MSGNTQKDYQKTNNFGKNKSKCEVSPATRNRRRVVDAINKADEATVLKMAKFLNVKIE